MRRLVYFVVGFVIWMLLTWTVDIQVVIAGIVASAITAFLFHEILPKEHCVFTSPVRMFWLLVYLPVFFYYVIKANFDVAYRVLHPAMPIKPGIVRVKLGLTSPFARTMLANSITMTPGTISVDIVGDEIFVHWIYVSSQDPEQYSQKIAGRFEKYIKKIFE